MVPAFADFLNVRLASALPGREAQMKMAPRVPRAHEPPPDAADYCRKSAVLVLLVEGENEYDLLLTVRSAALTHHGGQISFPGGRIEPGEDSWQAALREAQEEVGLDASGVRKLGMLSPLYVPVSNNIMYPMAALLPEPPPLVPNPAEVEEALYVPLPDLASGARLKTELWTLMGRNVEVPYWEVHRVPLWGATAMILSELLAVYEEYRTLFG